MTDHLHTAAPVPAEPDPRGDHLAWAKERALEYLPDDIAGAYSSLVSDLNKHPATQGHGAIELGGMLLVAGHLSTPSQMREWIEGFN